MAISVIRLRAPKPVKKRVSDTNRGGKKEKGK